MIRLRAWAVIAGATLVASAAHADGLDGRVLEDHTGSPLPSAAVRIFKAGVRTLAADLDTGTEGRFHAPTLPAGDYRLEVAKPNYVGVTMLLTVTAKSTSLTIRLVRCAVITGQVLDQQGQPVRGARVFALPKPADGGPFRPYANGGPGIFASVNERGEYRLYNLAPGQYGVAVTYGASSAAMGSTGSAVVSQGIGSGAMLYPNNSRPQLFTVSGGEEFRGVDFTVLPNSLFQVTGQVELPTPKARGFWVALTPIDQDMFAVAVAVADEDGKFQLTGVPAGSYYLFATGPSNARSGRGAILGDDAFYARSRLDVVGQDVDGVHVSLQKGRTASFLLRAASSEAGSGACPASAQVTLSSLEDWAAHLDRTVDVNFARETAVENLAPARYHVSVSKLGDACYQAENAIVDLSGAANSQPYAVLVSPAGSIRGKLAGASQPQDFVIALVAGDSVEGSQAVQVALPDGGGKFSFSGLRPGHYRIAAQLAEGTRVRWVADLAKMFDIEVPGGAPTDLSLPAPVRKP